MECIKPTVCVGGGGREEGGGGGHLLLGTVQPYDGPPVVCEVGRYKKHLLLKSFPG